MNIRPCATFTSDLPEDHIENEAGTEILQFGGKSVIEAIGGMLTRLGCTVDAPIYANENGWELTARLEKRPFWCQVTLIDGYVLVCKDPTLGSGFLGRHHPVYLDLLTRLAQELANDPRFHDVLWFTEEDVLGDVPGSPTPL